MIKASSAGTRIIYHGSISANRIESHELSSIPFKLIQGKRDPFILDEIMPVGDNGCMKNRILTTCTAFLLLTTTGAHAAPEPAWVEAMRTVHSEFSGKAGYVAQFGDSITHSMAFWNPMSWSDPSVYLSGKDGLPRKPGGKRWRDVILGTHNKGPEHGNYSGWTSSQVRRAAEKIIPERKPETAIILAGSNDIRGGKVPEDYRANLEAIVDACLSIHCIPILNTLPPFRDRDAAVDEANRIIRDIARQKSLPLADYHAACLARRPGASWDGTLISNDGVHPSAGKPEDYSEQNLKNSGYALRNWVNFLVYRELYFKVLTDRGSQAK